MKGRSGENEKQRVEQRSRTVAENATRNRRTEQEQVAKVRQYEDFVDKRLKPDLQNAISQRDALLAQRKTFTDLAKSVHMLQQQKLTKLRTMINLGSEVYAQAEVPDLSRIFVDIGLGFHAEFTWQEALNFIVSKEEMLTKQIESSTGQIANIKAQIKLVCEGIRELMNLPSGDTS